MSLYIIWWHNLNARLYLHLPLHNDGFPFGANMRSIISISHSIDNSAAFFIIPFLLLAYVVWRPLVFSNLFIFSFTLPILHITYTCIVKYHITLTLIIPLTIYKKILFLKALFDFRTLRLVFPSVNKIQNRFS